MPHALNGKAMHKGIMGPENMKPKLLEVESEKERHPEQRHISGRDTQVGRQHGVCRDCEYFSVN